MNHTGITSSPIPTKYIGIYPGGYGAGNPKIVLAGKFVDFRWDEPQGAEWIEEYTFWATSISVGTV